MPSCLLGRTLHFYISLPSLTQQVQDLIHYLSHELLPCPEIPTLLNATHPVLEVILGQWSSILTGC
jgi:hypothetical protein